MIYQQILIVKYIHNLGLNALHIAHRLCQCNAIWNLKEAIKHIPNMCVKLVLGKSKYDSASQALQQLHWLPVQERIHHKILTLTHKCIYGQAPEYLKNIIEIKGKHNKNMYSDENGLLLRSSYIKHQTFASHSLKYTAPALWNGLPLHIRDIKDIATFKCQLKTHLYRKGFLT